MAANVAIVAGAFAISRVLGLVREIVIARQFGTGDTSDAYPAAFRIPDLIFVVVMSGAFGSASITRILMVCMVHVTQDGGLQGHESQRGGSRRCGVSHAGHCLTRVKRFLERVRSRSGSSL